MGLGLPLDGVAAPRSVPRWIRRLRELGVAGEDLEFHPHNDTHLVVANCLAAIQAGCAVVNGTLLGRGAHRQRPPRGGPAARIGMGLMGEPLPTTEPSTTSPSSTPGLGAPLAPTYPCTAGTPTAPAPASTPTG